MRAVLIASLALLFAYACVPAGGGGGGGGTQRPITQNPRPRPIAEEPSPATPKRGAPGTQCSKADDCESNICEGEGCGEGQGTCAPAARGCTRDLREYCGCDGKTFSASGSCPGQRFSKRGAC